MPSSDACSTIETVPDDFFLACKRREDCRMERVPAYLRELQREFLSKFENTRGVAAPQVYAMRVACKSTFGGRWFAPGFHGAPGPAIVVILTGREYERAVLLHEMTHWGRWVDGKDRMGRHDKPFLREVEKAYEAFRVSPDVASSVEHHPPGYLANLGSEGRAAGCYGLVAGRKRRR